MGDVFLANDTRLGRDVAIKLLGDRLAGRAEYQTHLLQEARAAARLSHPNIATVHDVLDADGETAIVMEYLRGETLAARIARGPLPPAEALRVGLQVTSAVAYAHQHDVLHCDIKPANVFLTDDGVAKVLDFGLARLVDADSGETSPGCELAHGFAGVRAGTLAYMPPESFSGARNDTRRDVYSLGVTLHEAATGVRPASSRMREPDPSAVTTTAVELPSAMRRLPVPMRSVLTRALSVDPAERFPSATEMHAALRVVADREHHERGWRALSVRTVIPLAIVAVVVAGLTTAAWRLTSEARAPSRDVLAVLPFTSSGLDATSRYLLAGLTETVTSDISTSPDVVVVAAASVAGAAARSADPARIAHDVGATRLLGVDVESVADHNRLNLRIFEASTGQWRPAGVIDAQLGDIAARRAGLVREVRSRLRRAGLPVAMEAVAPSITLVGQPALEDYAQGREFLSRGEADAALRLFERAVEREPGFALAHAAIGDASWRKYRTTKQAAWAMRAQSAAFEAMRLAPQEAAVRYTAAVVLHGTGRTHEAEEEVRRAIERQPASDDARRLLGRIYAETGRFDKALPEFEAAIALRPGFAGNYRALGLACFDNGRFDQAVEAFQRETELRPDDASAFQALGTAYHAGGRLTEALANYERAIAIAPSAFAYSNIGMIQYSKKRYQDAVSAYEKSARLVPSEAVTYRNLGDALMRAGARPRAIRAYQRAIDLAAEQLAVNQRDGRLISLQALCAVKMGETRRALARTADALAVSPADSEVLYQAGVVYALAGDRVRAGALLRDAVGRGFSATLLADDEDLASLRASPEFIALLKEHGSPPHR